MSAEPALPGNDLGRMLRVERTAEREFTARLEDYFGAAQQFDLLARAALAASETCELELVGVRASFLRPPPCGVALRLSVEPLQDAPGEAARRVRVAGDALFADVTASFAARGAGPEYAPTPPDGVPKPEHLPSTREVARQEGWEPYDAGPIEFRRSNPAYPPPAADRLNPHREWLRPRALLPPEPRVHAAALVFASQFYSQWAFEWRVGPDFANDRFALLDAAVWLHESARWDDFVLLEATSDVSRAGRALGQRRLWTRDGRLVASAAHSATVALRG